MIAALTEDPQRLRKTEFQELPLLIFVGELRRASGCSHGGPGWFSTSLGRRRSRGDRRHYWEEVDEVLVGIRRLGLPTSGDC